MYFERSNPCVILMICSWAVIAWLLLASSHGLHLDFSCCNYGLMVFVLRVSLHLRPPCSPTVSMFLTAAVILLCSTFHILLWHDFGWLPPRFLGFKMNVDHSKSRLKYIQVWPRTWHNYCWWFSNPANQLIGHLSHFTLPETNSILAPENGWLEYVH